MRRYTNRESWPPAPPFSKVRATASSRPRPVQGRTRLMPGPVPIAVGVLVLARIAARRRHASDGWTFGHGAPHTLCRRLRRGPTTGVLAV